MLKGIDIYNHTRTNGLDLAHAKAGGIQYAIVKATEGVDYTDPSFVANVNDAHKAGLPVGAYHFLRSTPIQQQCHDFLMAISGHGPYCCLAIDVENPYKSGRVIPEISDLGKAVITSRVLTLYQAIRAAGYTCPVYVYSSAAWLRSLIDVPACRRAGMLIWMASYSNDTPNNTDHSADCDMWQWCSDGNVPGITGNADCNVCYRGISDASGAPYSTDTHGVYEFVCGGNYRLRVTCAAGEPYITAGTDGICRITPHSRSGNDYFYDLHGVGAPGQETGIYINHAKASALIVRIVSACKCDTGGTIIKHVGECYTIGLESKAKPKVVAAIPEPGKAGPITAAGVFADKKPGKWLAPIVAVKPGTAGIYVAIPGEAGQRRFIVKVVE